ncbi:MAG: D-sedoheptulose 7-phosphate isomerase [Nitrospirae bacterium]|nr:D-sedoheptulose 7-phosphate isomerase [Nitrospirota bacterium]MBI3594016.1 D-sedoheptulose 7-phosphate isomerase [Nitrospirota bacterium]
MTPIQNKIREIFDQSIETKKDFIETHSEKIEEAVTLTVKAFRKGLKIFFFGNGGSASDASHLAAEFVNRFKIERPGLPALALATDMAVLTSIGNDYDYSEIFSRQIKTFGQEGDIAVAISTSGNSPNVVKGALAAKEKGMKIIAFTGGKGGKIAPLADLAFVVRSTVTARIQETHITLGHVICELVDEVLYGSLKSPAL